MVYCRVSFVDSLLAPAYCHSIIGAFESRSDIFLIPTPFPRDGRMDGSLVCIFLVRASNGCVSWSGTKFDDDDKYERSVSTPLLCTDRTAVSYIARRGVMMGNGHSLPRLICHIYIPDNLTQAPPLHPTNTHAPSIILSQPSLPVSLILPTSDRHVSARILAPGGASSEPKCPRPADGGARLRVDARADVPEGVQLEAYPGGAGGGARDLR